jgi:23S rRNA (pseudouridine1915-N3)-methyltransferase
MHLTIAAIGRLKAGPERALLERFVDRVGKAGRSLGLTVAVREFAESRATTAATRKDQEAAAILAAVPRGAVLVALDEAGTPLASRAFAERIAKWRESAVTDLVFVIGGADGLAPAIAERADFRLAFGPATWPHQLVRIMLAEQLYRVVTILTAHPYHRD